MEHQTILVIYTRNKNVLCPLVSLEVLFPLSFLYRLGSPILNNIFDVISDEVRTSFMKFKLLTLTYGPSGPLYPLSPFSPRIPYIIILLKILAQCF